jgi:3-oxoacyl-[acyl-carrier protein] reductase
MTAPPSSALKGQVAIITGAGKGIGRAIALAYAKAGAQVCCAARTLSDIEATRDQILADGGQAIAVSTDVTQRPQVDAMVKATVDAFGGLDTMFINAGIGGERTMLEDMSLSNWQALMDTNLTGAFHCLQAAIAPLKARGGGRILALGSGLGHHGMPGTAPYACSKAGLWMLVRVAAQELAAYNISVNELVPGPVNTAIHQDDTPDKKHSLGPGGEWLKRPEDVTPMALMLAGMPLVGPTAQSFSLMRRAM